MRFLVVQLSDIHLRAKTNPVLDRIDQIVAAIRSVSPHSEHCLLLGSGDIAWSGLSTQYEIAELLFSEIVSKLTPFFENPPQCFFIPGNHDCVLAPEGISLRKLLIDGLQATLQSAQPDAAVLREVLAAQDLFNSFADKSRDQPATDTQRIFSTHTYTLGGTRVRVNAYNTALLSQRNEVPGALSLPLALIERLSPPPGDADITMAVYHHPDNWLEPNVRRSFRKMIDHTAHIVFTGHEHEHDSRLVKSEDSSEVVYFEADALQDESYPKTSGFTCVTIDTEASTSEHQHFRWKGTYYGAVSAVFVSPLNLAAKSTLRFANSPRFHKELSEDDFGFTHSRKPQLQLADIFVYPSIALMSSDIGEKSQTVPGPQLFVYILRERRLLFQGTPLSGKTALLKTVYKDLLVNTIIVPLFLDGSDIYSASESDLIKLLSDRFRSQYTFDLLEPYMQLIADKRAVLIDNWHKCRLTEAAKKEFLELLAKYASITIATSNDLIALSDIFGLATREDDAWNLKSARIKEFSASGRGAIIDKWIRIGQSDDVEDHALSRDVEKEQAVLDYLIGKKTLPSLPYLILGVLQARQSHNPEVADPGSFGFLVQKLVLDALSVSKGKRKFIDRKDAILRRVSFEMFNSSVFHISVEDFKNIVSLYKNDVKISVDQDEILDDLLYARVLTMEDGNLAYTYHHFYFYFLAKHFIDEIEGPRSVQIRAYLDDMADKPLTKANQQTLIFFLFFKKRDPIIDKIIAQANATFKEHEPSNMMSDTKFLDLKASNLKPATIDTSVSTEEQRTKRLEAQDKVEIDREEQDDPKGLDTIYDEGLAFNVRNQFATARLELLGQVIRNFPGSLDGEKKVEILDTAFRLGLRNLHAAILELEKVMERCLAHMSQVEGLSNEDKGQSFIFVRELIALFVRACCDSRLLAISRAVGVNDLEQAYAEAISQVGDSPATRLIDIAIRLDHSNGFPFKDVQRIKKSLPDSAKLAHAVLTDLIVRHTQVFKLKRSTLRSIATLTGVNPLDLLDRSIRASAD